MGSARLQKAHIATKNFVKVISMNPPKVTTPCLASSPCEETSPNSVTSSNHPLITNQLLRQIRFNPPKHFLSERSLLTLPLPGAGRPDIRMDQLYELQTQFSTKLQPQQLKSSIILKKSTNQALNRVALEHERNLILHNSVANRTGAQSRHCYFLIYQRYRRISPDRLSSKRLLYHHFTTSSSDNTTARSQTNFVPSINENYCSI